MIMSFTTGAHFVANWSFQVHEYTQKEIEDIRITRYQEVIIYFIYEEWWYEFGLAILIYFEKIFQDHNKSVCYDTSKLPFSDLLSSCKFTH